MRLALLLVASAIFQAGAGDPGSNVEVRLHDAKRSRIFSPGETFSVDITATVTSGAVRSGIAYQWRDFRGEPLGPVTPLKTGVRTTVSAPSINPQVGYYGLALLSEGRRVAFNSNTGNREEIGFAVLARRRVSERPLNAASPFGVVHAELDDPYLPTWIKTMTWHTSGPRWWGYEMKRRRDRGFLELPLVSGDGWTSDDTRPVADKFIAALKGKIRRYFEADPEIEHWELGREENLRSRFEEPRYFDNLKAKVAGVREVAADVNPKIQFLYQVAGRSLTDVKDFLASDAADEFDILAPHPYVWPDFPPPEEWIEAFIDERREAMRQAGRSMPMWFTEIGAPQNDARVPQMLSGSSPVRGQARDEHAAYIIKVHVLALARGIERIIWYNYRDRDSSPTDVEDHFGMIDYWGFPKPAYPAYVTMTACLDGKGFQSRKELAEDIHVYEFKSPQASCYVAWLYPGAERSTPLSAIDPELDKAGLLTVTNAVGTPLNVSGSVSLSEFPVFITARREPD